MRNPFVVVDDFIFDKVLNPITQRIEYETGINHIQISRFLFLSFGAAYVVYSLNAGSLLSALLSVAVVAMLVHISYWISLSNKSGFINPERKDRLWIRCYLLFSLIFLNYIYGIESLLLVGDICLALGYYILSCDKMPPGWKKPKKVPAFREHYT